jgi:pimeloyl-ACP methyl ester carboxylesterase
LPTQQKTGCVVLNGEWDTFSKQPSSQCPVDLGECIMDRNDSLPHLVHLHDNRIVDCLHYGAGNPHLWLHSGFRGRIGLSTLIRTVERELKKRKITVTEYIPQLAGFGESTSGKSQGANPYEMADDIVGLVMQLDVTDLRITGYSLGANVAAIVANKIPERVHNLVLIGTAIEGGDLDVYRELYTQYAKKNWDGMVKTIAHRLVGDKNREQYLRLAPLVKKEISSRRFERDLLRLLDTGTRLDVFAEVENLSVPTLMISGIQDPFVPNPERRKVLEANENIKMKLIDGTGHNEMVFPRQVDFVKDLMNFWNY